MISEKSPWAHHLNLYLTKQLISESRKNNRIHQQLSKILDDLNSQFYFVFLCPLITYCLLAIITVELMR